MQAINNLSRQFLCTLLLVAGGILYPAAQSPASREYQLKAVFLFNFTQFVSWPPDTFPSDQAPLVIGILGENPFGSYLEQTITGEKVDGHPLVVQYYHSTEEIKTCQILFFNLADTKKTEQALLNLKERNTLLVSDTPDFLKHGGMIGLLVRNNKIQLRVNLEATKAAGLVISSKLLRLAEVVHSPENN